MRITIALIAVSVIAGAAFAKDTREIKLKFASAEQVLKDLAGPEPGVPGTPLPTGVTGVVADKRSNTLVVTGEAAGLNQMAQMVHLLDVPTRQVTLNIHLFRRSGRTIETLQKSSVVVANNKSTTFTANGADRTVVVQVQTHINGDGTLTLTVLPTWRVGLRTQSIQTLRRVRQGAKLAIALDSMTLELSGKASLAAPYKP